MNKQYKTKRCITSVFCIMLCIIFIFHNTSIDVYAEDVYNIQWDGTLSESLEYYGSTKYTSYVYRGKTENFNIGSFKKIVIPYTVVPQDGGCNQHVNEQYPSAPQGTIKDAATGETIDTFYGSWENTEGISQNVYIEVFAYCIYQYTEAKDSDGYYRWFWRMYIQNLQGTYTENPRISANLPSEISYNYGDSVKLSVIATNVKSSGGYKWYKNGELYQTTDSGTLTLGIQDDMTLNGSTFYVVLESENRLTTKSTSCILKADISTYLPKIDRTGQNGSDLTVLILG